MTNRTPPTQPLFTVPPTRTAPVDHHWFVPDQHGAYCQACGLPRINARHTPKAA